MRKKLAALVAAGAFLLSAMPVLAKPTECVTIPDDDLKYSAGHFLAGEPLMKGYDPFGYNYQAHMFKGTYANVYLGRVGFPPYEGDDEAYLAENPAAENHWAWLYRSTNLLMKWNDAWLANKDCNRDGELDRHLGYPTYIGSGAWETNHMWDSYEEDSEMYNWNYFTKIVAVPSDAYRDPDIANVGTWYTSDDMEIGPDIWREFATIMDVYNDQGTGEHGIEYLSPAGPGFGKY